MISGKCYRKYGPKVNTGYTTEIASGKTDEMELFNKVLLPTEKNPLWFYVGFIDVAKRDAFDEQLTLSK